MKRKRLILAMSLILLLIPASISYAGTNASSVFETQGCSTDQLGDIYAGELTKHDIVVVPAKRTLRIGQSFHINIGASDESEFEDLDDEEWDELIGSNIESITFQSSKNSIASVNSRNGKVTGHQKGTSVVVSHIQLSNGENISYKTKVYVTC